MAWGCDARGIHMLTCEGGLEVTQVHLNEIFHMCFDVTVDYMVISYIGVAVHAAGMQCSEC